MLVLTPAVWNLYASRDQTRREHLVELQQRFGFQPFTQKLYRQFVHELDALADQTHQGLVLANALIEAMRREHVIIPPVGVVERFCAEVATRAQRRLYRRLTAGLSDTQRRALDALLELREGSKQSTLAWLRQPPGAPNPRNLLAHIERLRTLRTIGLPPILGRDVNQNHLLRVAREGAQTTVHHLREFEVQRRHATLELLSCLKPAPTMAMAGCPRLMDSALVCSAVPC